MKNIFVDFRLKLELRKISKKKRIKEEILRSGNIN